MVARFSSLFFFRFFYTFSPESGGLYPVFFFGGSKNAFGKTLGTPSRKPFSPQTKSPLGLFPDHFPFSQNFFVRFSPLSGFWPGAGPLENFDRRFGFPLPLGGVSFQRGGVGVFCLVDTKSSFHTAAFYPPREFFVRGIGCPISPLPCG